MYGEDLTVVETRILLGMSHGLTNAEIGERLGYTRDTIGNYAKWLFRKLGARDRGHAVRLGFEGGWLQAGDPVPFRRTN